MRAVFWRLIGLVRPHRRRMALGVILGLGVALTYATSLGGILPVLTVVVEKRNLNEWLHAQAVRQVARAESGEAWSPAWHSRCARFLDGVADLFPAADAPNAAMYALLVLLGGVVALNLIGNVLRTLSQYLVLYATHRAVMDLRRHMYRRALHVPINLLGGDVSSIVSQFMSDVREIFVGITTLFGKVAREPLKAVCVLGLAVYLDYRLTLVAAAIAPPAVLLLWYFGRRVRKATLRLLEGYGRMLSALEETLQGIDVVKGYTREGHERRRMWGLERRMLRQQLKLAWIEAISSPLIEVIGLLAASAGIVWLAGETFHGEMTASHFMTMVVLLAAMLDPIRKIANVYNMVQRSGAAANRVFQFLDRPEEHSPRQPKLFATDGAPRVGFRDVTFRYTPEAPPALHDVSLVVEPGQCLAIVGPNGSGKSTLLRLLPRFFDPQAGAVLVNGVDVRALSLRALRSQISLVSQRPVIFARSARENIAYGSEHATLEEIRAAARQAYAAEFIEQWPQGYETVLGEFGATLSGGQRQRIAIARAFLKRSTIVIFDEATSEIDAESERKIHAALNELRRGRTTFLIAHRHTVMEMAERIAVMEEGRIVDVGTHAELIARCPLYVALYRSPAVG